MQGQELTHDTETERVKTEDLWNSGGQNQLPNVQE